MGSRKPQPPKVYLCPPCCLATKGPLALQTGRGTKDLSGDSQEETEGRKEASQLCPATGEVRIKSTRYAWPRGCGTDTSDPRRPPEHSRSCLSATHSMSTTWGWLLLPSVCWGGVLTRLHGIPPTPCLFFHDVMERPHVPGSPLDKRRS